MEIEVKLRLPDLAAHQKVLSLLSPYHTKTHHQRNTFFDGACGELSTRRAVLRLRFYENSENVKCMLCLKAKAVIIDGVSRVEEDEEELDPKIGYECVSNPRQLMQVDTRVLKRAKEEFHVGEEGFIGLGGFKNVRNVFEWNGVELEVDETMYEFGTCYEIECESLEPEKVKAMIEALLKENDIDYSYSEVSKFATFRAGKLP
ncbi:triphosphate tunnel metalloenzyme 3 isoform X2 [Lycium ferocissimum]|uniref:triphosphate tunnel metalloenzyme 3 isoform X1 n=1 Tax=Lycium ferocissimum TaxID=112874 RepID=UPI002816494A|nr:triphosphate tunnel metalloenzyme 3 isoform X1 [Lycium ferocissimum]XP_059286021.1 triphosphate tunnel metalloenzyme 3 isoform X2 [Lycium ferocissimum]